MHTPVFYGALIWLGVMVAVCVYGFLRWRAALPRLLVLDVVSLLVTVVLVLFGTWRRSAYYFDGAVILALFGYISTVAAARFHMSGRLFSMAWLALLPSGYGHIAEAGTGLHLPDAALWLADGFIIAGTVLITTAVYGLISLPDVYTQLHAASKGTLVGAMLFLFAALCTGEFAVICRTILIAAFLLSSSPTSSYVIARAGFLQREKMKTPAALDESGRVAAPGRPL